ncbi:MAG: glycosyltransferase family 4 protein [Alphaproteobacteria bacterium]
MKKLLFDIDILLTSKGKETGICREAVQILKELSKCPEYTIYPLVPCHTEVEAKQCLCSKGLEKLSQNVVYLPNLKATCGGIKKKYRIKAKILEGMLGWKYKKELSKYDEYFSVFSPISPLVHQAHLKTRQIINDLFPIQFPKACDQKFIQKYSYWMKQAKADEFICISKYTQKDFLTFRPDIDKKKIKVAYLAADERFKPAPDKNIKKKYGIQTPYYFLGVSDHNPRKNFPHLIQAFIEFAKTQSDISLVLVGPKKQFNEIEELVGNLKELKDKIILTGFVPDEDLPALYTEAELFVYPSLYEGFGLPVLEAMQCGTPVLTCRNTSLPEVGGDSAEYISGKNIQETVQKMVELHQNADKRKKMSSAGLKRAKQFSWADTVNQIFNLK